MSRLGRWWALTHLRLLAVRALPSSGLRRRRLHTQVQRADREVEPTNRPMDVLVVDLARAEAIGASAVEDRLRGDHDVELEPPSRIAVDEINRLVDRFRPDAICLLASHAVPCSPTWIQQLGHALSSEVAVAVPTLVHPERPGRRTPHDLLTRSRGIVVEIIDGVPRPVSAGAGEVVDVAVSAIDPIAATATCALVDGEMWREVGGLSVDRDADAAAMELCLRIGATGRRISNVPAVLVSDWRPVDRVEDLACEIPADSPTWRSIVDHHGPALRRSISAGSTAFRGHVAAAPQACSITVTTAVPSAKLTDRWGDWPFASAFASALRRASHPVLLQTLDQAHDMAGRSNDVQVVIRGLAPVPRTPGQVHVLWVISHPESVTIEEYDGADLVLVASPRFARHVRTLTTTPVEVFLQAPAPSPCPLRSPAAPRPPQVLVVANSRGVRRRVVADAEEAGVPYSLVGGGWDGTVSPDRLVATQVAHDDLPRLYASAELVLNDHWDTMAHWGFVSNRILDVLACGTPGASDHVPELEKMFGDLVPTWRDPSELAEVFEAVSTDASTAHERALAARDLVLEHHTFDQRARELIDLLARHDLLARPTAT